MQATPAVIFAGDFESYTLLSQLSPAAQATTNDPSKAKNARFTAPRLINLLARLTFSRTSLQNFRRTIRGSGKNQW